MSKPIRTMMIMLLVILAVFFSCKDEPAKTETAVNETGSVSIDTTIKGLHSDHDASISYLTLTTAPLFVQNEITGVVSEQRITVDSNGHAPFGVMSQGQWRFTLKAFNLDGDLLYTGLTQTYIAKGIDNTVAIDLGTYTSGSGTLSINLTSISLTNPSLNIQYMKPGGSWNELSLDTFSAEEVSGGSINYRATATLQTGPYIVSFQLKSAEGITVGGETLNTHIFENGTTRITGNFTISGDDGNFIKLMPGQTVSFKDLASQINIAPTDLCRGFYIYGGNPSLSVDFPYTNTTSEIVYAMPITAEITDYFSYSDHTVTSRGTSSALKYLALGLDVQKIGDNTFEGADILDLVTYTPSAVGNAAFKNSHVRYVSLEGSESIGDQAFYGCSGLTSLEIPSSMRTIGSQAFQASSLTEIAIPSTVTSVGSSAFRGCAALKTVSWTGADIPDYAFTDSAVSNLQIEVQRVGTAAFSGCSGLTTVEIPEGTEIIGNMAFAGTSLSAVRIPTSMTNIGSDAFSSTQLLASIHVEKPYDSIPGKPWGSNAVVSWANYILTFEPNGSQQFPATVDPASKIISYGGTYGTLPDATINGSWDIRRTGHTFLGWFTSATSGNQVYPATEYNLVTSSTVYAHWVANKYHASFNTNAASLYKGAEDILISSGSLDEREITYGLTYGTMPVITKPGYTFDGWFTHPSGGDKIESGTQVLILEDQTLYAHWTANKVSVGFSNNNPLTGGGTTVSTMQTYGSRWSLPSSPTFPGYTFDRWTVDPTGGAVVTASGTFCSESPMTVYAQWTANPYTVTLNLNASTLYNTSSDIYVLGTTTAPAASIEVVYDNTYSALPTLEKRGHAFNGWYTSATGGTKINSSDTVKTVTDMMLYAHWTPLTYDATFHTSYPDGTDGTQVLTQTYGTKWKIGNEPTYTGYTKNRSGSYPTWYDVSSNAYTANNVFTLLSDVDLYARWTANTYTITLNLNAGSLYRRADDIYVNGTTTAPPSSVTVTYDSKYSALPELSKKGFVFDGWYTASVGGTRISSTDTVRTASSQTLYAHWTARTYTVTYTLGGGNIGGSTGDVVRTQAYGSPMTVPAEPERTGYSFTSWKDASSTATFTAQSPYPYDSDRTITATWTARIYITTYVPGNQYVTQNSNYSFTTTPSDPNIAKSQTFGSVRELPDTPQRTGFNFVGWYTAASGGEKASSTIPAHNETLYARWTPYEPQVTFVYNDDTSFSLQTSQIFNQKYILPTQNKTKTGMTFAGWYFDQGCSVAVGENVVGKTSDHSIYARWTYNEYQATFNANGGSWADSSTSKVISQTYASRYSMPSTNPTRTGYDFVRWNTAADGSGTTVSSSAYVTTPADHSVYAIWKAWDVSITFDINSDGLYKTDEDITGSWNSIKATYDRPLGTLPAPTKPGYTFDGWYVDGNKITASSVSKFITNKTAVAHWTANTYTLTYNANASGLYNDTSDVMLGGTLWASATKTQTFTYGSPMTGLKSLSKQGYTFNGLWTSGSTSSDQYTASSVYDVAGPMTLYAHWTANIYTVTYDANAGSLYNTTSDVILGGTAWNSATKTQSFTYGSTMNALKSLSKTGYTFDGWFTEASGGTKVTASSVYSTPGALRLYAHWTVVQVAGTFNTNLPDGTSSSSQKTLTYASPVPLPSSPSFTGWEFQGWFTAASGGSQITSNTTSLYTTDTTFYAHWASKGITLDANAAGLYNAGNDIFNGNTRFTTGSTSITTAHKYASLPTLTKSGYTFNGWYDAASGGNRITTDSTYSVNTLYAHWTANTYTVTLNLNASSLYNTTTDIKNGSAAYTTDGSLTLTYGGTYAGLPTLSKAGYTFGGWYTAATGGTNVTTSSAMGTASAHSLYARWTANQLKATFNSNYPAGTNTTQDKTQTYGSNWVLGDTPSYGQWTFDGWYTATSGGSKITSSTKFTATSDQTVYGHWYYLKTAIGMPSSGVTGGSVSGKTLTYYPGSGANSSTNLADYYGNYMTLTASSTYSHTGGAASVSSYTWWIEDGAGVVEIRDASNPSNKTQNTSTITTGAGGVVVVPLLPGTVRIRCRATNGYGDVNQTGAVDTATVTCQGYLSSITLKHSSGKGASDNMVPMTVRNTETFTAYHNSTEGGYVHVSQGGLSSASVSSSYGSASVSGSGTSKNSVISFTAGYNATNGDLTATSNVGSKQSTIYFSISGPAGAVAVGNGSSISFLDAVSSSISTQAIPTTQCLVGFFPYEGSTSGSGVSFNYSNSTEHTVWLYPIYENAQNPSPDNFLAPANKTYLAYPNITVISGTNQGTSLQALYIPDTVTTIADGGAFKSCRSLSSIRIGSGLKSIGSYAFYDCDSLGSFTFSGTTKLGYASFYDCDGLTSVSIPSSVSTFDSEVFSYCSALTSVTVNCSTIGSYAFRDTPVSSLSIGSSCSTIGSYAFYNCDSLSGTLTIPAGVSHIGGYAFQDCSYISTVKFNRSSAFTIGTQAFCYCSRLTTVDFLSLGNNFGGMTMGSDVWYGCNIQKARLTRGNFGGHLGTNSNSGGYYAKAPGYVYVEWNNTRRDCSGTKSADWDTGEYIDGNLGNGYGNDGTCKEGWVQYTDGYVSIV